MNKFLRYITLGGIFLSLFLPLYVNNYIFFPFISGKNFAFRIIVEIIFATWIILMLRVPEYRPRMSQIMKAVGIFVIVLAVADVFGVNPYKSFWSNFERMEGLIGILHLFAYLLVVGSIVRTEKLWGMIFHTSIGVSLFTSLFATLQAGGELAINQGGLRVDATFGNAIYLAVYLLFHIFLIKKRVYGPKEIFKSVVLGASMFLIYYIFHIGSASVEAHRTGIILSIISLVTILFSGYLLQSNNSRLLKTARIVLEWCLIAFYIVIIGYTATRGVVIGLGASMMILGILFVWAPKSHGAEKYRKIGAGILTGIVVLGIAFFVLRGVPSIRDNKILGRIASISLNNDDALARFRVWNMAIQGFKEKPILGWGQEGFNYVFNKYYDPKMYAREQWFDRTHNVFFDWLSAAGLLGLLAYLWIFVTLLRSIWKSPIGEMSDSSSYTLSYAEKVILTSLIGGYFVQNFFVFDNLTSYIIFFLLLSYVHFVVTSRKNVSRVVEPNQQVLYLKVIPSVVVVLLVIGMYFFNVKPILAGRTLIKALQSYQPTSDGQGGPKENLKLFAKALSYNTFASSEIREQLAQVATVVFQSKEADEKIKNDFFELTNKELKAQLDATPLDARYELFTGVFLNAAGRYTDGVAHLEKALELSPRKQSILFELGTSYLNSSQFDKALEAFKKAYELDEDFSDAKIIYALGAVYDGKYDLADSILTKGFGTVLIGDPRLVQAYFNKGQYGRLIEIYTKLIKDEPNNGELHLRLAGVYFQNGQRTKSIEEINKAMEIDPKLKTAGEDYIKQIKAAK